MFVVNNLFHCLISHNFETGLNPVLLILNLIVWGSIVVPTEVVGNHCAKLVDAEYLKPADSQILVPGIVNNKSGLGKRAGLT